MRRRRSSLPNYRDPKISSVFLDANVLDDCEVCNNHCVERICDLNKGMGGFQIVFMLPNLVRQELDHKNTPKRVKERANDFIYTIGTSLNADEKFRAESLKVHFRGNGIGNRHDYDSDHIFEAVKYGAGYFVTEDARIRKKAISLNLWAISRHKFIEILGDFEI